MALAKQHIEESRKAGFTLGVVWGFTGSVMVKNKLDRLSEARQDAAEILKIWSWYNLDYVRRIFFLQRFRQSGALDRWVAHGRNTRTSTSTVTFGVSLVLGFGYLLSLIKI
jgi:hypothetical protein